jgi:phenylpyruvate tautomerase PptA (4-oxalocrotonate tautomerase family)
MPYISLKLSKDVNKQQKEQIKARIGEIVTLLPGKTEAVTMVDISGGHSIYLGGKALENGGFVEIRLLGNAAEFNHKKAVTEAIFDALEKVLGTPKNKVYLNILEFSNWGAGGTLDY